MDKETASFAEFARAAGIKRSYVTALRKADRLVLAADGKRVLVAESLARIEATRDPSKAAVAARHAAARGAKAFAPTTTTATEPATPSTPSTPDAPEAPAPGLGPVDEGFQYWKRRSEKAKALAGERENAVAEGRLLDAADVARVVADATTTLRTRMETLPDTLGPQLAAISDEGRVRALIAGEIEHALTECARQFAGVNKRIEA